MKLFLRQHIVLVLVLLVLGLGATTYYFYQKSTNTEQAETAKEVKSLVGAIGKLTLLPSDETPTVATVSDPEALKDQSFFVGAIKDDKVLIYSNAKKAILYRPSIKKIINIAPLNLGETTPVKKAAPVVETETEDTKKETTKK